MSDSASSHTPSSQTLSSRSKSSKQPKTPTAKSENVNTANSDGEQLLGAAQGIDAKVLFEDELVRIETLDDLRIAAKKTTNRNDEEMKTALCYPRMRHLSHIRLILRRIECKDELNFDLRRAEALQFTQFRKHPNLVKLYSFWQEPTVRGKRILAILLEEVDGANLESSVKGTRMGESRALRYLYQALNGLAAMHEQGIVHGGIKPRNVFRSLTGNIVLDLPAKTTLDAVRAGLIAENALGATSQMTQYWAPELFNAGSKGYTEAVDIWALGLTFYEVLSGMYPFEGSLRPQLSGLLRWDRLTMFPRVISILKPMLAVNPGSRYTVFQAVYVVKNIFALSIQRVFRGFIVRKKLGLLFKNISRIQARVRGYLSRKEYYLERQKIAAIAYLSVDNFAGEEGSEARRAFTDIDYHIMQIQAVILTKKYSTVFQNFRFSVIRCQAFIRRYLVQHWYKSILQHKHQLTEVLLKMNDLRNMHRGVFVSMLRHFKNKNIPLSLQYLASFNDFEHALGLTDTTLEKAKRRKKKTNNPNDDGPGGENGDDYYDEDQHTGTDTGLETDEEEMFVTAEARMRNQIQSLQNELVQQNEKIAWLLEDNEKERADKEKVKKILGLKYAELAPMTEYLVQNLKRVADLCSKARSLPVTILQHSSMAPAIATAQAKSKDQKPDITEIDAAGDFSEFFTVTEFDPMNICESILQYNDRVFKADSPVIDFSLHNGKPCFISEVLVSSAGNSLTTGPMGPGGGTATQGGGAGGGAGGAGAGGGAGSKSGGGGASGTAVVPAAPAINEKAMCPAFFEVYISQDSDRWIYITSFNMECNDELQSFVLPGEQIGCFVRLVFRLNARGGTMICLRYVSIKGINIGKRPGAAQGNANASSLNAYIQGGSNA